MNDDWMINIGVSPNYLFISIDIDIYINHKPPQISINIFDTHFGKQQLPVPYKDSN
jgi:hypothetical protein